MFRAYDSARERLVAVKLFKLDLPPERGHQLVAEFERLIAAELTHPALAAPLATGISGVSAFLAQDYVAADSLDLAVREYGPAPVASALRVAAQLAGALDYAAAVQIVHGALHPRDVLLSSDDTRLTGLGVARALETIGVVAPVRRPYTAPERIAGGEWDRRTDVFSLAALMHELMWGRRVSGLGARAVDSLTAIEGGDLGALQDVFARALAEDPHERFETALEFADALRLACPHVAIAPDAPAPKRKAASREIEPRLPLDEDPGQPLAVGQQSLVAGPQSAVDSPQAAAAAEPLVETEPVVAPEADFIPEPVAAVNAHEPEPEIPHQAPAYDAPTMVPAGLITGHDPDALSALEVTRSAVWPLVLALGVGIAIGFAGGFFAGSREQPVAPIVLTTPTPPPAAREFTEAAVPPAPAPAPNSELKTKNSELKTKNSEPKNSEPKNPQSAIRNPQSAAAEGRLVVRTRPEGARVSVDGKDAGKSPAAVRDLAPGAHRVKITHEGYTAEERRIVISATRPSQSLTVPLAKLHPEPARVARPAQAPAAAPARFTGALVVDSRPAGAKVFMDGKLIGATPMSLPSVPAGSHAIRLEHDGYRNWSSSVRVVATEQNRVTASLER